MKDAVSDDDDQYLYGDQWCPDIVEDDNEKAAEDKGVGSWWCVCVLLGSYLAKLIFPTRPAI